MGFAAAVSMLRNGSGRRFAPSALQALPPLFAIQYLQFVPLRPRERILVRGMNGEY